MLTSPVIKCIHVSNAGQQACQLWRVEINSAWETIRENTKFQPEFRLFLLLLLLFLLNSKWVLLAANGFYSVAVLLQQDTTQKYTYHTTLKQNTAYKATQTMKDILHTIITTQEK
jgi:hypothetical protein